MYSLSQNLSEVYLVSGLVEGFHVCEIDLTWVSRRIFETVAHGVATLSFPLVNVHVDPWSPARLLSKKLWSTFAQPGRQR